jgi:adenylosuccinate lyase
MIDRYTTPAMAAIWSEQAKFQAWLDVEIAACEQWYERGAIPTEDMDTIRAKARFDLPRIQELDAQLHHDVLAFTTCLAENIGPASRHVHKGLTSTDVVDTAQSLRIKRSIPLIQEGFNQLQSSLLKQALENKDQPVIGRTHGIHGEPTSLGLKFLLFADTLRRDQQRVLSALQELCLCKLSGAVGTFAHTDPEFEAGVARRLDLPTAPIATQVLARDRHAALLSMMAVAGGTIENIAVEIRHYQRTEVREIEEPFAQGQKGSSAMPHKRNPVKCEQLTGLSRLLRGYAISAMESQALWHERDISHSSVERVALIDAMLLLHYMLTLTTRVIDGLHIYPQTMAANLERTRGLPFSQKVMLELTDSGMTREEAYGLVQEASMRTWADPTTTLQNELQALPRVIEVLGHAQLAACFDPSGYLRHVPSIFDRVLASFDRAPGNTQ